MKPSKPDDVLRSHFIPNTLRTIVTRHSDIHYLASKTVEGASLALEGVDDVESSHGLAAGVLGVGDGVADDVLEEDLEDTAGLLVDESRDALDTTTASQAADRGLGDALDVVAQHLAVALGGSALSESLSSLSTARHSAQKRQGLLVLRMLLFEQFAWSSGSTISTEG